MRYVPAPAAVETGNPFIERLVAIDNRPHASRSFTLLTIVVTVAVLYFARVVVIPFALAILVSFLLAPLVIRLRHWHFGRVPSVLSVVLLGFLILAVVGGLVSLQLADLAHKLPEYQVNMQQKLHSVRESSSGTINRLTQVVHTFSQELTPTVPPQSVPGEVKPVPVEIRRTAFSPLEFVRNILGSLLNAMFAAAIVIVMVIFMLFQREDLRDRLIRLVGAGQINLTTKALDDAAHRVSRYLLVQLGLNAAFGVLAGVGLLLMGVPNPILWGVLAAMLRYVPYLGIWVAAAMPAAVALATNPGWLEPLGIFGLYFGIDLMVINFVEPVLYGNFTGISPMAILVAAVFWTWLWGPIGLLLSTPLTVCLVVIGHHVPSMEFLSVLLGDEPVFSPEKRFYQRLLALDLDEATEVTQHFLKEKKTVVQLYDEVIIPALVMAKEDRHRGRLDHKHEQFILEGARLTVQDLGESAQPAAVNGSRKSVLPEKDSTPLIETAGEVAVICIPARDEADEIAAAMLAQLLEQHRITAKSVSAESLASERLEEVARAGVKVVCVTAVPPFAYPHARYLSKRLRQQFPDIKIIAAILNRGDAQELKKREPQIPAEEIVTSLDQALSMANSLALCSTEPPQQTALSA